MLWPLNYTRNLAERVRFERTEQVSPFGCLANSWFKPLTQRSKIKWVASVPRCHPNPVQYLRREAQILIDAYDVLVCI